ncbi:MAG: TMEM165/GDT1 family protein [Candidatus Bathyarchaeia archaeon]
MLEDLLLPLITVGLAELGDKTQLSLLLLSSRIESRLSLLLGVLCAFLIVDGVAVMAGSWATQLLPEIWLKVSSGAIFIILGALILLRDIRVKKGEKGVGERYGNAFLMGFTLIFLTEWGDKTQISSALLAAKYNPYMVFIGTMSALAALSMVAVYLGGEILSRINRRLMMRISGLIFMIIGIYMIFDLFPKIGL